MKENCKRIPLLVIIFLFFIFSLTHSKFVVEETLHYTDIFFSNVFPTSFIFLLFSSLLMELRFFQFLPFLPSSLYFFIIALFSGFPTGIIQVADAYRVHFIDLKSANKMVLFCHFPNPIFILYTVSIVFGSMRRSILFYGILLFSNFLILLFQFQKTCPNIIFSNDKNSFVEILTKCLFKTFQTILLIFGISLFFYLLSCVIAPLFSFSLPLYTFVRGTFDLTSGILQTSFLSNHYLQGILLYYFIGFGSLSIQVQIKSILSDTPISYRKFIIGRIVSFLICCFLWIINWCCTIFAIIICFKFSCLIYATGLIIDWCNYVYCVFGT